MSEILKLFRPATLISPAVGALLFQSLAIHDSGITVSEWVVIKAMAGIIILAMANAAGNIINHVVDAGDTDQYHPTKRNRAIASGKIDKLTAISLTVYIFGVSMFSTFIIFGTLSGILVSIILFFSWAYSAPPRFKKRFIMSNLSIGTPRGFLGVVAAYSFFNYPTLPVLAFGLILGVFVFGVNTTKDIGDYDADKRAGIRNFVTVLGVRNAIVFIITPFLYIPYIAWGVFYLMDPNPLLIFVFLGSLISVMTNVTLVEKTPSTLENHKSWYYFYAEMAAMIILFTVPQLMG